MTDGSVTSSEIYGLGDATLTAASVAIALGGSLPAFDVNGVPLALADLALIRLPVGAGAYTTDFTGFDMLVELNLSTGAISAPRLGIDGADAALLSRGYTRNTSVGGSGGAVVIPSLALGGSYVTLVPEGTSATATISGDFGSGLQTAVGLALANGQALYLTAVPEPSTFVLAGIGLLGLGLGAWRRRRA